MKQIYKCYDWDSKVENAMKLSEPKIVQHPNNTCISPVSDDSPTISPRKEKIDKKENKADLNN